MRVASPVASLRFPLFTLLLMRHQLGPRGQRAPRLLWPRTGVASGKRCSLSAWAGVEPWGQLLLAVLLGMCSWDGGRGRFRDRGAASGAQGCSPLEWLCMCARGAGDCEVGSGGFRQMEEQAGARLSSLRLWDLHLTNSSP